MRGNNKGFLFLLHRRLDDDFLNVFPLEREEILSSYKISPLRLLLIPGQPHHYSLPFRYRPPLG